MKIYQVVDGNNNVYSPKGNFSFVAFAMQGDAVDYCLKLQSEGIDCKVAELNEEDIEDATIIYNL